MSRVALGISGGVDSAVSAWILGRDGHDVVAITFLFHDTAFERERYRRAADICARLGIEHHEVAAYDAFGREVLLPFLEAHERGVATNPNAVRMRKLIYPMLEQAAVEHGCDSVALGSYAAISTAEEGPGILPRQLVMPLDKYRDETYYFWWLTQEQLGRTVFPLCDTPEPIVRQMAMRAGLMMPELEEGLQIRFLGGSDRVSWLEGEGGLRPDPGDIVHISTNEVLGTHEGLHRYVLGKRCGLVDARGEELYAVAVDQTANRLLVGPRSLCGLEQVMVRDVHWTSIEEPRGKRSCRARFAHTGKPVPVQVLPREGGALVTFNERMYGVVPTDPIVFYSDKLVLGGGTVAG